MPDDLRVQELLDELLDREVTPEEVCSTCPELLPVVRKRWQQICRAQAELDALLPISPGGSLPPAPPGESALPQIPGYEIEAVLGHGGMGVVFRALHLRLGRLVALKMALARSYASSHERERFRREAEAVAALRHANIVQVYDVGDWAGQPYFTMEYFEGGSLAQLLSGTPQPAGQAAPLLATLAEAMHAAHQVGIVHRDLKPANILFTSDGTPKITDFGLARRLEDSAGLTLSGVLLGTPSYMAPEQARGQSQAIGPAVDVYALGAILYELLTGRPPFRAETPAETVLQVINQEPVSPARLNVKVPRDLETVCLKCLQKEPARRYGSAEELANDLRRYEAGEPIRARPVGSMERTWKWAKRRPALAVLLGVLLLAVPSLAALSGNLVVARNDAEQKRKTAEEKEAEAREEADKATKAQAFLVSIFQKAERGEEGGNVTVRQLLAEAETRIPVEFAGQPELRKDLADAIGKVKRGIARRTPQAMVLDVRGRVTLHSHEGKEKRVVPETLLNLDDRLSLGADGEAELVLLSDLHKERLKAGREVTIDSSGCDPADAVREHDDSVLMTFVRVPKGTFYMGWNGTPGSAKKREIEADFEIAVHDVTQGQWEAIMGNNPSWFSRRNSVLDISDEELKLFPVENVSWDDVQAFLQKLNAKEGGRGYWYRLPSEAEWEYVCREGATSEEECSYHFYVDRPTNDLSSEHANFNGNFPFGKGPKGSYLQRPTRVGAYPANRLGLYDMHGNVWQWTDTAVGLDRVFRGGCWRIIGSGCRAADRYTGSPTNRGYDVGFRLARVPTPAADVPKGLAALRAPQGNLEALRSAWEKLLEREPSDHDSWYGYAELCLFLGREEDHRLARRALLKRFGATRNPFEAERSARACLLLPGTDDELRQAVALTERAVAEREDQKWAHPYFEFVHGLAEYRQGQFDRAIAKVKGGASGVLGPAPRLVLALSFYQSGQAAEARTTLAAAVLAHDWRVTQVRARDQNAWIYHILRREAEAMILPNLQAFRQGDWQPQDNDERLALLGMCESEALYDTASRLCADAFEVDPDLAERLTTQHLRRAAQESDKSNRTDALISEIRYRAARCAALAGCGLGEDSDKLGAAEQTHWRRKSLEWLRTDLVVLSKTLDSGRQADRDLAKDMLTLWQDEPDLAGLREPARLERLAGDERKDCLALWGEVGAVLARCGNTP